MFTKMITLVLIGAMSLYPKMGNVQRVNGSDVYIVDNAGEMWQASNTGLQAGDRCRLLMSTNGTNDCHDDIIIAIEKE